jgi:hypothetical protein
VREEADQRRQEEGPEPALLGGDRPQPLLLDQLLEEELVFEIGDVQLPAMGMGQELRGLEQPPAVQQGRQAMKAAA